MDKSVGSGGLVSEYREPTVCIRDTAHTVGTVICMWLYHFPHSLLTHAHRRRRPGPSRDCRMRAPDLRAPRRCLSGSVLQLGLSWGGGEVKGPRASTTPSNAGADPLRPQTAELEHIAHMTLTLLKPSVLAHSTPVCARDNDAMSTPNGRPSLIVTPRFLLHGRSRSTWRGPSAGRA